jgi:hypothetical protein
MTITKKKVAIVGGVALLAAWALSRYGRARYRAGFITGPNLSAAGVAQMADELSYIDAIGEGLRGLGVDNNIGLVTVDG